MSYFQIKPGHVILFRKCSLLCILTPLFLISLELICSIAHCLTTDNSVILCMTESLPCHQNRNLTSKCRNLHQLYSLMHPSAWHQQAAQKPWGSCHKSLALKIPEKQASAVTGSAEQVISQRTHTAVLGPAPEGLLLRPRHSDPTHPALSIQAVVLPDAFPQTVPTSDEDLLGLPLTRVSCQVVSVVGQSLK